MFVQARSARGCKRCASDAVCVLHAAHRTRVSHKRLRACMRRGTSACNNKCCARAQHKFWAFFFVCVCVCSCIRQYSCTRKPRVRSAASAVCLCVCARVCRSQGPLLCVPRARNAGAQVACNAPQVHRRVHIYDAVHATCLGTIYLKCVRVCRSQNVPSRLPQKIIIYARSERTWTRFLGDSRGAGVILIKIYE